MLPLHHTKRRVDYKCCALPSFRIFAVKRQKIARLATGFFPYFTVQQGTVRYRWQSQSRNLWVPLLGALSRFRLFF
jgi:hypothetical protein